MKECEINVLLKDPSVGISLCASRDFRRLNHNLLKNDSFISSLHFVWIKAQI